MAAGYNELEEVKKFLGNKDQKLTEECPECEQKFPDLRTLSDHFDENHEHSSEEDEEEEKAKKVVTKPKPPQPAPRTLPNSKVVAKDHGRKPVVKTSSPAVKEAKKPSISVPPTRAAPSTRVMPANVTVTSVKSSAAPQPAAARPQPVQHRDTGELVTVGPEVAGGGGRLPPVVVVRHVADHRVRKVRDVAGARLPSLQQGQDPFLASFLSFMAAEQFACGRPGCGAMFGLEQLLQKHMVEHEETGGGREEVVLVTYGRPEARLVRRTRILPGVVEVIEIEDDEEDEDDPLSRHIRTKGLPLVRRGRTPADGNCWYHAVADQVLVELKPVHNAHRTQVLLHGIPGVSYDHTEVRAEVCRALPSLPQAEGWKRNVFGGSNGRWEQERVYHSD